jgi:SAM-dependent methyltransferase
VLEHALCGARMNWRCLKLLPWVDTRAAFVASVPTGGILLDLGSSDGETLRHFAELRPDLRLRAVDLAGRPETYPAGCEFQRANLETDRLGWAEASTDAITCMHLVEHLQNWTHVLAEAYRLLKPGGRVYFETPHPKTVQLPRAAGSAGCNFTFNFYDDPTHVRPVETEALARKGQEAGFTVSASGISRNWLFALSWLWFMWRPASRQKFTAQVHWLGWSAYLILRK